MTISDDERRAVRDAAASFCRRAAEPEAVFAAMATGAGYDPAVWRRLGEELGVHAMLVPESRGGLGWSFDAAAILLEEAARAMLPSPLLPTVVVGQVLQDCGTPAAAEAWDAISASGASATLAVAESAGVADLPTSFATVAEVDAFGAVTVSGRKCGVLHGDSAQWVLVAAHGPDGPALYAVDGDAPGVERHPVATLDQTRRLADLDLDHAPARPVGGEGDVVGRAVEVMLAALAVDAAGVAADSLRRTVEYLLVREQFGRVLGSFQALRHRCAVLAVAVQGATATARAAATAVGTADAATLAPLAKAVCADVAMEAAGEMVQLHGGIGFTFEHPAHLYLKRAKSSQILWGRSDELKERAATAAGV